MWGEGYHYTLIGIKRLLTPFNRETLLESPSTWELFSSSNMDSVLPGKKNFSIIKRREKDTFLSVCHLVLKLKDDSIRSYWFDHFLNWNGIWYENFLKKKQIVNIRKIFDKIKNKSKSNYNSNLKPYFTTTIQTFSFFPGFLHNSNLKYNSQDQISSTREVTRG